MKGIFVEKSLKNTATFLGNGNKKAEERKHFN